MSALPEFKTDRLILKELRLEHADDYQKKFNDYEIIRNLNPSVPWPYPENGAYEHIQSYILPQQGKTLWAWGLFLTEAPNELIGAISVGKNGPNGDRGFWLEKPQWGKGLMSEALVPVMDYAFEVIGFDKMMFCNAIENKASTRVKAKTGASFVKYADGEFVDPNYKTKEIWQLTKENWLDYRKNSVKEQ